MQERRRERVLFLQTAAWQTDAIERGEGWRERVVSAMLYRAAKSDFLPFLRRESRGTVGSGIGRLIPSFSSSQLLEFCFGVE